MNQHNEYYVGLRARANAAGDEMARNFDEAHKAYERGDGARAKELSNAGKAAQKEMERLNEEAAAWIFRGSSVIHGPTSIRARDLRCIRHLRREQYCELSKHDDTGKDAFETEGTMLNRTASLARLIYTAYT